MSNIPITAGSGTASVATETVGGISYQQVELYGAGGASVLGINPDGSIKASIIGIPNVVIVGGSIASAGVANQSVSGVVGASIIGLPNVNISGSVVGFQAGTRTTSLVSTVPSSVIVGSSIFGQLPAGTAVLGSVATLQGTNPWIITGSVQGTFTGGNSSVQLLAGSLMTGSVVAYQGVTPWVITGSVQATVNTGNSSVQMLAGSVMIGSVAAYQGSIPWTINSVYGNVSGSVVAFQGTTPWTTAVGGSVISIWAAPSMVGTYATNTLSNSSTTGLYVLAVRNDAVASIVGTNLDLNAIAVDSAGRIITKPFAADDSATFRFQTSTVATSVILAQASAIGKRNYVTDMWFSNTGATTTLVTIKDGSNSVLGYTIVPTGGGSNSQSIQVPLRTAPSQDLTVVNATATSILYITINGYQAP